MFSFFLPKEIDADKVTGKKDIREALILDAKNNITIRNIDYFQNHDNYIRFQRVFVDVFFDAKQGRIPRIIGIKLNQMDEKYGLAKLFDAERNKKYFSQNGKKQSSN